ncbi:Crp/Fnr family transcriptional regulator [Sphingomonas quercus]|uniref:Crp/Fnr family transcriptional regulator n=1 Tax=Sphingomonas quercus TaxID=2842451 RepID=A0ABS6BHM3_9SPHN|nr:Crp/Fnr family transcriptional regulator [Sphingomonas quercus]MBU3077803.1 Crp/Fnr family transcriptional regulator [Sphingomonas quercus]
MKLTAGERDVLRVLESQRRTVSRGTMLRRERDPADGMWVLQSGWAASALGMPDGSRQITKVHLPGDVVGTPGGALNGGVETVSMLTSGIVSPFPRSVLTTVFRDHQRLAALFFVLVQVERVSLSDRIASIGRTDARARVAALLLDLTHRLRLTNPAMEDRLSLPMTQEDIGDTVGLTAVHVNRMMRALADDGLIARGPGSIRLLDEPGLARISGYISRWSSPDTSWLPEPPEDA